MHHFKKVIFYTLFFLFFHSLTTRVYSYSKSSFSLQTGCIYSDNLYLEESDKIDELTVTAAPAFSFNKSVGKHTGRLTLTPTYTYNLFDTKAREEGSQSLNGGAEIGNISLSGNLGISLVSRDLLIGLSNSSIFIPNAASVSSSSLSKGESSAYIGGESLVDSFSNMSTLQGTYLISRKRNSALNATYSFLTLRYWFDDAELEELLNNSSSNTIGLNWTIDIIRNRMVSGIGSSINMGEIDLPPQSEAFPKNMTGTFIITNNFPDLYKFTLSTNFGFSISHVGDEFFSTNENNFSYVYGATLARIFLRDRISSSLGYSRSVSKAAFVGTTQPIQVLNIQSTLRLFRFKGLYLFNPTITGVYNIPEGDGTSSNTWTVSTNFAFPLSKTQGIYFNYSHTLQKSADSSVYPEFSQNLFSLGYFARFD